MWHGQVQRSLLGSQSEDFEVVDGGPVVHKVNTEVEREVRPVDGPEASVSQDFENSAQGLRRPVCRRQSRGLWAWRANAVLGPEAVEGHVGLGRGRVREAVGFAARLWRLRSEDRPQRCEAQRRHAVDHQRAPPAEAHGDRPRERERDERAQSDPGVQGCARVGPLLGGEPPRQQLHARWEERAHGDPHDHLRRSDAPEAERGSCRRRRGEGQACQAEGHGDDGLAAKMVRQDAA
mmetsp:Transcript_86463/g.217714  ORF Transcript_86463/g.217714 Transcript_86463/m.217714 type:complete len:235 (-) Transcript_86463:83-787(-)